METNSFIEVMDDMLSVDACNKIIFKFENALEEGVQTTEQDSNFLRKDVGVYSEYFVPDAAQIIKDALAIAIQKYEKTYFTCDEQQGYIEQIGSNAVKLQKTTPRGGYHQWHCEQSDLDHANRVLAWMFYLNDVPKGEGETEFLWQGVRIQPKAGTCAIWPAAWTHVHRGNPVYNCNKYIATGWFHFIQ